MKIHTIPTGPFQANCILLFDETTKQGVVIDPGDEPKKIIKKIQEHKIIVTHILLTHAHLDHIMGVAQVKAACGGTVWLHKYDEPLYVNSNTQAEAMGLKWKDNLPTVERYFDDQDVLTCGALNIRVIHTPGHSAGSVCFEITERAQHPPVGRISPSADAAPLREGDYMESPLLVTGDTLFAGSVGRTDLWGSKAYQLKESLIKLAKFPENTRVIPGHGPETTIGREKKENLYLIEQLN